ncbi:hypothetical protein J437_LFUL018887 [Ladona fulva]|uniref:PiggyBac transposable element-derived protein domain-containing protein n=1 Tax=Ladona fulva TaxID=123851 RepID=A0A8K0KQG8_LADFU|nr:hypothetical protein J437_LFUL018887 [Ladona fulva]
MLMLMGIIQKPSLRMYFNRKQILETPFFPIVMSEERFALLNKFLHFVDNSDEEFAKRDPKLPDLFQRLVQRRTDAVGTVKITRKGVPNWLKKKLKKGEVVSAKCGKLVAL